jgi:hypothetical protein
VLLLDPLAAARTEIAATLTAQSCAAGWRGVAMTYHVFDLLRLTPHRDAGGAELPADVCARAGRA